MERLGMILDIWNKDNEKAIVDKPLASVVGVF
jgi:hypothetical protein